MEAVLNRLTSTRPSVAALWSALSAVPGGKAVFSTLLGVMAPYTRTIGARVRELSEGHSEVVLRDRYSVRNHLDSVHAIALMNLGEMSTGLAVLYTVDGRGRGIIRKLEMEYVKKARGTITATCDVTVPTARGDHDVEVQSVLRNEAGVPVAYAKATWKITVE